MWIVMTSAAKMPATVRARYRNVALVKITDQYADDGLRPKFIGERAKGVIEVRHLGHFHVGKTDRGAFQNALVSAENMVKDLNGNNGREI